MNEKWMFVGFTSVKSHEIMSCTKPARP